LRRYAARRFEAFAGGVGAIAIECELARRLRSQSAGGAFELAMMSSFQPACALQVANCRMSDLPAVPTFAADQLFGLPPPRFLAIADGTRVPYASTGEGEPVVFIHGSLCDFRYWKPQLGSLSAGFCCIAPSLSHYWPAVSAKAFGWREHVEEMAAFIGALGLGPVHVVGHSRGGCIAFQLAVRHPGQVKSLVLADPGGPVERDASRKRAPPTLPAHVNALRARAAELIERGEVDAGLELFVDSVSRPGYWARSPREIRMMSTDNAQTLALQVRDPLPAYDAQSAARVKCPTLLIDGEKSPGMFRDAATALERWIDGARRMTIEGASHGMNVTHAARFNLAVAAAVAAG
jgi:pimeloyl-ACP methyl ester carboxylesterase